MDAVAGGRRLSMKEGFGGDWNAAGKLNSRL
jgi:hypothetical protein